MSLAPITPTQQKLIIKNVVAACKDIDKLNGTGYKFINLASGFIAHYNLNGFKAAYAGGTLRKDILRNINQNMWSNFRPGDVNYEYYMSKRAVYQAILSSL